ncbi:hypothetical protein TanjilG_13207 [Lupinus angustifolius]|uniref:Uncharacterized protein n=1 Tax=Lupinus angustifolius TaxID=3871 RepID=A0A4P1RUL7_LUPAN|nr:PREDICTED: uncharacterized protein LOC109353046 [Lupinus angustifolius]OIW18455.1 hypothetical protein TanjilG_13207 [Lupinus angustifolius]
MATEILRPQDCLIQRIRVPPATFSRHRSYTNCSNYYNNHHTATSRSYRKPVTRPDQRKRVDVGSGQPVSASVLKRSCVDDSRMTKCSSSTMEKVMILRRGESLDSSSAVAVKSDIYAGSAFSVVAPSPSALPLPSFPAKKQASPVVDDSATRDLRRLLRLD